MTEDAARFTGSIPEHYDRNLGPHLFMDYAADLARRVAAARPTTVLELAAGTGIVTRQLRDRVAGDCTLIATDLNAAMLDVARSKFRADEAVRFEPADAGALPFDDASCDVVTCQFGVMFFPDKAQACREALRVLTPGGRYIFNVWDAWAANPFARIAHAVVEAHFPDDTPGFYKVPFGYHDVDDIRSTLLDTGFEAVAVEPVDVRSKIPSAREFGEGLVYGNPLLLEIQERGGDPERVCEAVTEAISRELGGEMPLRALVIEATKASSRSS